MFYVGLCWHVGSHTGDCACTFAFRDDERVRVALKRAVPARTYRDALLALGFYSEPVRSLATTGNGSFRDLLWTSEDLFFLMHKPTVIPAGLPALASNQIRYGRIADLNKRWPELAVLPPLLLDAEGQFLSLFNALNMAGV